LGAERVLFVGDAAAATDPLTGEGIGQALATGVWAAEAITTAGPFSWADATARYAARVHDDLVRDHRLADRLSGLLAGQRATEAVLALAGATARTRRNFARWLFEDYPRAVLGTPDRWHRDLFRPAGAYAA